MSCGFLQQLDTTADAISLDGTSVLVAVSGGADSMALLRGLLELRPKRHLRIVAAHLNHQLRGTDSETDADWIAQTCTQLSTPCLTESRDVRAIAAEAKKGLEETARHVRYEFLLQSAVRNECSCVALAHTADDQAETILHHFVRGTGISGLRGMEMVRETSSGPRLIRPILGVTRQTVEDYLRSLGQEWRVDASNEDPSYTRNRIRGRLLPLIEGDFNPQFRRALLRLGRQAREMELVSQEIADAVLQEALIVPQADTVRLRADILAKQSQHVVRECFRRLWSNLGWPRQRMGFEHWDHLAQIARDGGAATLPGGIDARRNGVDVILRRVPHRSSPA